MGAFKGKGEVQTYLVFPKERHSVASMDSTLPEERDADGQDEERQARLVDWNHEILSVFLKRLIESREGTDYHTDTPADIVAIEESYQDLVYDGKTVIDEMMDTISFPEAKPCLANFTSGGLDPVVATQLQFFVSAISKLYRDDVPFHNFGHVSHVVMGAFKLMKRIIIPDTIDYKQMDEGVAQEIHENTYGISSDPLLHFAVVFSALIHDVGHCGLTNTELVKLGSESSIQYRGKSVAEQNSVDLAWQVLMEDQFKDLRASIYGKVDDLVRFRHLVINAVMATDIADKELKYYREKRWDHAFAEKENDGTTSCHGQSVFSDQKATIVYEYIIQAADVCHTMQHWHTYQRFNKRLFEERYVAWLNGHLETDPSVDWYRGEIWFFDNYIIPMAEKLYQCGVFGVSYHELLTYAKENKREWESKGVGIVKQLEAACEEKFSSGHPKNLDE